MRTKIYETLSGLFALVHDYFHDFITGTLDIFQQFVLLIVVY